MDPSTFVAPTPGAPRSIIIEFCDRVSARTSHFTARWLICMSSSLSAVGESKDENLRRKKPLSSEDTAGRFRIWLAIDEDTPPVLVWDRKVEGQFPELRVLVSFSRSPRYDGNASKTRIMGAP